MMKEKYKHVLDTNLKQNKTNTKQPHTNKPHVLLAVLQTAEKHHNLIYTLRYFRNSTEALSYVFSWLAITQSYVTFETQLSYLEESILDLKRSINVIHNESECFMYQWKPTTLQNW